VARVGGALGLHRQGGRKGVGAELAGELPLRQGGWV